MREIYRVRLIVLSILTIAFTVSYLGAKNGLALVQKQSVEDLAKTADRILTGTVKDIRSEWDSERTTIDTNITISVDKNIKGAGEQKEINLKVSGGEVGDEKIIVSDMPRFKKGERTLVFLRADGDSFRVVGQFQGKFTMHDDKVLENGSTLSNFINHIKMTMGNDTSPPSKGVEGAPVDDVPLHKYGIASPVIYSVTPSTGSAGTSTQVTIAGNNFGGWNPASSRVLFSSNPVDIYAEAPIAFWSNTSILVEVPVGASSGTVVVLTTAGMSNPVTFTVTFAYGGVKWYDTNLPLYFYINSAGTPDALDEFTATQNAFQTWENVPTAHMDFTYGGMTTRTGANHADGYNVLSWSAMGGGVIAVTAIRASGDHILEVDVVFNDLYVWSDSGEAGKMDVQNIAAHEIGHWLLLDDLYGVADVEKTMYGYGDYGETKKRTLEPDDVAGISWIYPGKMPRIDTLNPRVGAVGIPVIITGTNFGTGANSTVAFNGVPGTYSFWSNNRIDVTVPAGATSGPLVVSTPGGVSNGVYFTITSALDVSNLSYSPSPYDPTMGSVTVSYNLNKSASTYLIVMDLSGNLVRSNGPYSGVAGANSLTWNGRNQAGSLVAASWYVYVVYALDGTSSDYAYDLMWVNYGSPLVISGVSDSPDPFSPSSGQSTTISATYSRAAYGFVNVYRYNAVAGSWEIVRNNLGIGFKNPGTNTFVWDGRNDTGAIVSNGTYSYLVLGIDSSSNIAYQSGTVTVQ